MRKTLALAVAAAVMLAIAVPVGAITNGELDVDEHPYVGIMIAKDVDGEVLWRCSGTLMDETHFLTAGHCTEEPAVSAEIWFDSDIDQYYVEASDTWTNGYPDTGDASGDVYTHPDYDPAVFFLYDLGMVVLDEAMEMDEYGALPELNQLDELKTRRGKKDTTFTSVGYGLQRTNAALYRKGTEQADRVRMVAYPHLLQINSPGFTGDFSLLLSNNHSTGGTCFGDSGGPNFLGDSNVVAGVTSFGLNSSCGGTGGVYRVDRADDLDWLETFGLTPTP